MGTKKPQEEAVYISQRLINKPPYRPLKEKVSITLDMDIVEALRKLAEEDQRSFSQYINRILRQHIERNKK